MTPQARFQNLQRKELYSQCLYWRARGDKVKHRERHFQRDFTYQDKRASLPRTQWHWWKQKAYAESNFTGFFKVYKTIIKKNTSRNLSSSNQIQDKVIYILQTININDKNFTIFYDTRCGIMVSKYCCTAFRLEHATGMVRSSSTRWCWKCSDKIISWNLLNKITPYQWSWSSLFCWVPRKNGREKNNLFKGRWRMMLPTISRLPNRFMSCPKISWGICWHDSCH